MEWNHEKKRKKIPTLLLLLKFQSKKHSTDRARNAPPIEITTKAPGVLLSISAGLGKQHLVRLQIK